MGEPSYRALLIGNSTFPADSHNLQTLEGPVNDVTLLRAALTDHRTGMFDHGNVRVVAERTSAEILQELEQFFVAASRQDLLLLYYSGHGLLDERGQLFLAARDTRSDLLRSTSVSSTAINMMFDASAARTTVIVIDCCHAGAFKGSPLPDSLRGAGRYVVTSCRSGQLANDADRRNHTSLFTQHFVEGLTGAADDHNGDGFVDLDEVFDYVRDRLIAENRQIPQRDFAGHGDVAIARRPSHRSADSDAPAAPVPSPQAEPMEVELDFGRLDVGEESPRQCVPMPAGAKGTGEFVVDGEPWVHVEQDGDDIVVSVDTSSAGRLAATVRVTAGTTQTSICVRALIVSPPPAAPGRHRRAGVFALVTALAAVVLAVLAIVVTVDGDDDPTRAGGTVTTAADAGVNEAPRPFPPDQTDLDAGLYTTSSFQPRFTVTVADGWRLHVETADDVELRRADGGSGSITLFKAPERLRRDRTFRTFEETAGDDAVEPPVGDPVSWLQSDNRLLVSPSRQTVRAGVPATEVHVAVSSGYETDYCLSVCAPLFRIGDNRVFVLLKDNANRIYFLDVGGEQVVVVIEAPPDRFEDFVAKANGLLTNMSFTG